MGDPYGLECCRRGDIIETFDLDLTPAVLTQGARPSVLGSVSDIEELSAALPGSPRRWRGRVIDENLYPQMTQMKRKWRTVLSAYICVICG